MEENDFNVVINQLKEIIDQPDNFDDFINEYANSLKRLYEKKKAWREKKFEQEGSQSAIRANNQYWEDLSDTEKMFMEKLGFPKAEFEALSGGIQVQFLYFHDRLNLMPAEMSDKACFYEFFRADLIDNHHLFNAQTDEGYRVNSWFHQMQDLKIAAKLLALVWGSTRPQADDNQKIPLNYKRMVNNFNIPKYVLKDLSIEEPEKTQDETTREYMKRYDQAIAAFFWSTRSFAVIENKREDDISERLTDGHINSETIAVWIMNRKLRELEEDTNDYVMEKIENTLEVFEEMRDTLIGLEEFKNFFARFAIEVMNGSDLRNKYLNFVFEGPPGTGKTVAAKTVSKLFYALGVVDKPELAEGGKEDMVAGFEGQTAQQSRLFLIRRSFNAVTLFDEVDTLVGDPKKDASGKEAAEAIFRFISDMIGGEAVIIIAGYREEIDKKFFSVNRGLARRFDDRVQFEGYEMDTITMIVGKNMALKRKIIPFTIEDSAIRRIVEWIFTAEPEKVNPDHPFEVKLLKEYEMFGAYAADAEKFVNAIYESFQVSMFRDLKNTKRIITKAMVDAGAREVKRKKQVRLMSKIESERSESDRNEDSDFDERQTNAEFGINPRNYKPKILEPNDKFNKEEVEEIKKLEKIMKDEMTRIADFLKLNSDESQRDGECDPEFKDEYEEAMKERESIVEDQKKEKTKTPTEEKEGIWYEKNPKQEKDYTRIKGLITKALQPNGGTGRGDLSDELTKNAIEGAWEFIRAYEGGYKPRTDMIEDILKDKKKTRLTDLKNKGINQSREFLTRFIEDQMESSQPARNQFARGGSAYQKALEGFLRK